MNASPHIQQAIAALEAERADAKQHLDWIEARLAEFAAGPSPTPTPAARPRRRRSRSSNGHAKANGNGSVKMREPVIEYLRDNPGHTAGEIAEALDFKRNSVSTLLTKLAVEGALVKQERGYAAN